MTDSQLQDWCRARTANWSPVKLQLKLRKGQKPYAKPRRGFSTPAGLVESLDYMLKEQVNKGHMREVKYDSKYFVSQGFVLTKEGRFVPWPGT